MVEKVEDLILRTLIAELNDNDLSFLQILIKNLYLTFMNLYIYLIITAFDLGFDSSYDSWDGEEILYSDTTLPTRSYSIFTISISGRIVEENHIRFRVESRLWKVGNLDIP